jgi:hypothetical protein
MAKKLAEDRSMSCEEKMEEAKLLLARLMATQQEMLELHDRPWLSQDARTRLWSLSRDERRLHLEWERLEDAALAAAQDHQSPG